MGRFLLNLREKAVKGKAKFDGSFGVIYYFRPQMNRLKTPPLIRLTSGKVPALLVAIIIYLLFLGIITLIFYLEEIQMTWKNFESIAYFGLAFSYVVYVTHLVNKVHQKGVGEMLPYTELTEEERETWRIRIARHPSQWRETLAAILVSFLHAYLQGRWRIFTGESRFLLLDIWGVIQTTLIWVGITQSSSIFIRNMTEMNKLSAKIKIDLLNMDQLMPLTRSGVWSILGFIGVYSIIFSGNISQITLADPAIAVIAPSVFWMMYTPLKGIRKRVLKAKEKEMALIDKAIEGDRSALKESRIRANLDNINVIDLINYKKIIQNTFEIPVNIPTASRFVFYLIIPLLTWIAASIVDKSIDFLIK